MDDKDVDLTIIRWLRGELSADEEGRLLRWRDADLANEERYQELCAVWRMTARERPPRVSPPSPADVIAGATERRRRLDLHTGLRRAVLVASAVAVLVAGAVVVDRVTQGPAIVAQSTEITTGEGELTTVTLWDGTSVRVGPNSELRVASEGGDLVTWLDGRAFFGVVPGQSRRLVVKTPHGEALVLGTRFEAHAERDQLTVLVVQGSVRVSSAGGAAEVREGQMSRVSQSSVPSISTVDDVRPLLDWMGPTLLFRDTPLRQVLSEIEYQYGVSAELEDVELGDWPVTATFTNEPLERVVFVVCETIRAECSVQDGRFRIDGVRRPGVTAPLPGN